MTNSLRLDLVSGDCVSLMKAMPKSEVDLIIADPPYNLNMDYDAYWDSIPLNQYLTWSDEWIGAAYSVLKPSGSMWIVINDALVSEVDLIAKKHRFHKKSHVIWYFTFGNHNNGNFVPSHAHCLYYVKSRTNHTWNGDQPGLRVPSSRQLLYKDKRANPSGRLPDNTWILHPNQLPEGFRADGDTWQFSRVCGTFKERRHHSPNQLPVPLVRRMVEFSSRQFDLVLDPFLGSGTTGEVCLLTSRNFIGMDLSKLCVKEASARLKNARQFGYQLHVRNWK